MQVYERLQVLILLGFEMRYFCRIFCCLIELGRRIAKVNATPGRTEEETEVQEDEFGF